MISNRDLFFRHLGQTSKSPLALEISNAKGAYLIGSDGKKYLDLISGISVSNLGHGHPEIVNAVKEQADKYMHLMVYGELVQSPQVRLAEKLISYLPDPLDNAFLVNSGSEATEGALKLAKRYTGRTNIVCFRNAYHGSTHGSLSVMGNEGLKRAFRPLLPDITIIEFNAPSQLKKITTKTACVIAETIQGEAGIRVPDTEFMKSLRKRCDETGALLILDEIQCGFGRTGRLWAFEHFDIVPDILLLAKSLGGGLPLGAFIAPAHIMQSLADNPALGHITTFGGNSVCAAAAIAHFDVLVRDRLWEVAREKGNLFRQYLVHPAIKSIRGLGLMLALELNSAQETRRIVARCLEAGVLTDWFLFDENCIRIAPPLTITHRQISDACEILLSAAKQ
ncbi:MAG TPA: aspartate aminotransferase family protein [Bacteroidales bacterium]|nr:aspartate aminotransferase family protein [Bacteroidales bacterium]